MSRLERFQAIYDEAIQSIKSHQANPDMSVITNWLLTTDANPWSIFPDNGGWFSTAENFVGLLSAIHHALYDDGDICFPVINGRPRIVFRNRFEASLEDVTSETERTHARIHENGFGITYLETFEDFIAAYEESHLKDMMRCFSIDAAQHGVEYAMTYYQKYNVFDSDWVNICADDISKWEKFYSMQR